MVEEKKAEAEKMNLKAAQEPPLDLVHQVHLPQITNKDNKPTVHQVEHTSDTKQVSGETDKTLKHNQIQNRSNFVSNHWQ